MNYSFNYHQASDSQIWTDFLQGSREAYSFMYQKYARTLYSYGYKIARNQQLTEDCLQSLFLAILESRERLGPTDSIKFYLMRSLRREIVRQVKGNQRFLDGTDLEPAFRGEFQYEPTWLDLQIGRDRSEAVFCKLNQLPPRQKEALLLRYYDNLSYDEIAGIMGIETSSAYKVIYKAIASLQRQMPVHLFTILYCINRLVT